MNLIKTFSFSRFLFTLSQDILSNFWKIILSSAALWGTLLISLLYFTMVNKSFDLHDKLFPFVLVCVGLFVASNSFEELNDIRKGLFFLILPASYLEKFLSRFIITTFGYTILINLIFYTSSVCAYEIDLYLFNHEQVVFSIFNPSMITAMLFFLMLHSISFFSSIYFRKYAFLKMILSISGFILFVGLLGVIEIKIILWDYINIFSIENFGLEKKWILAHTSMQSILSDFDLFTNFFIILFKSGLVSLFFILLSYFRLKETEL